MNQRAIALSLVLFLCLSLVLIFLPDRNFIGLGSLLFGLGAAWPVFSLLRFSPEGWKAKETDAFFSIPHWRLSGVCIHDELLLGPESIQGDLLLPGGTYPVSRIRSLPGGVLLCAALAATYEHVPQKDEIAALFPEMNLAPSQFRSRFPYLRTLHLSSLPGQVVQDGSGERVFFCIDSRNNDRIRFMHSCQLVQSEGKIRELGLDEKRQLLDLTEHAVLLFTGLPRGNQVDSLTFLGALSLRHVQRFDAQVLADIRALENSGTEVFLPHPLQASQELAVPASPIPVHAAGKHDLVLEKESMHGVSLQEAVEQVSLYRKIRSRLFLYYAVFVLWISMLAVLSPLPGPAVLPFVLLPLIFPFLLRRHRLRTVPQAASLHTFPFVLAVLIPDVLILFLLVLFTASPVWHRSVIFHMLMLTLLECAYLPHVFLSLPFPSGRFLLFLFVSLLIVIPAAVFVCQMEGVFSVLLAALFGLLRLIIGLRKSSRP